MKFTISTELLKDVTSVFTKNFQKTSLEEMGGVLISVKEKFVIFKARQFDFNLTYQLEVENSENGDVVVDIETLNTIISSLVDSLVTIELDDKKLNIKTNSSSSEIYILTDQKEKHDFDNNLAKEKPLISLEKEIVVDGIKKTQHAASVSVIKPEIASVYVHTKNKNIYFVSTDTHRLALSRFISEKSKDSDVEVLISNKNVQKIIKVLEVVPDLTVNFYNTESGIIIQTESSVININSIQGTFPDYETIIPEKYDAEITILKSDITNFLKTSRLFNEKIKFSIEKNGKNTNLVLNFENDKVGKMSNTIPAQVKGSIFEIPSFNNKFLSDSLSVIRDERIFLGFQKDTNKPLVIKGTDDKSFFEIISPLIGQ